MRVTLQFLFDDEVSVDQSLCSVRWEEDLLQLHRVGVGCVRKLNPPPHLPRSSEVWRHRTWGMMLSVLVCA